MRQRLTQTSSSPSAAKPQHRMTLLREPFNTERGQTTVIVPP